MPDYYQTFNRNYDAALGRFVAVDPMAESAESMTSYQYAGDNPIIANDPDGSVIDANSTAQYNYQSQLVNTAITKLNAELAAIDKQAKDEKWNEKKKNETKAGLNAQLAKDNNDLYQLTAMAFSSSLYESNGDGGWQIELDEVQVVDHGDGNANQGYPPATATPGVNVYHNLTWGGNWSFPGLGIHLYPNQPLSTQQHEYGHYLQYKQMNIVSYTWDVAIPSSINLMLINAGLHEDDHDIQPYELEATTLANDFYGKNPHWSKLIAST